ncbi:MAG: NosD domain-containing protein, partial [Haloarculaceae archaeon]
MEPGDQEMVLEAVEDCEIVDNEVGRGGFRVRDASRNLLEDNTKRGHGYGVRLENADRNRLRTNTFVGEATITLRNADRNELVGNATDTGDVNVRVLSSTQNRIAGNRIEGGPGTTGVYLGGSDRNVILGNDVRGNLSGLVADAADLNVVYGNRFVGGDAWGTGLSLSTAAHNSSGTVWTSTTSVSPSRRHARTTSSATASAMRTCRPRSIANRRRTRWSETRPSVWTTLTGSRGGDWGVRSTARERGGDGITVTPG